MTAQFEQVEVSFALKEPVQYTEEERQSFVNRLLPAIFSDMASFGNAGMGFFSDSAAAIIYKHNFSLLLREPKQFSPDGPRIQLLRSVLTAAHEIWRVDQGYTSLSVSGDVTFEANRLLAMELKDVIGDRLSRLRPKGFTPDGAGASLSFASATEHAFLDISSLEPSEDNTLSGHMHYGKIEDLRPGDAVDAAIHGIEFVFSWLGNVETAMTKEGEHND